MLVLNPVVLVNATVPMETAQFMALGLASVYFVTRLEKSPFSTGHLVLAVLFSMLMVMSRPDTAMVSVACVAGLLSSRRSAPERRTVVWLSLAAGLTIVTFYWALNDGFGFIGTHVLRPKADTWSRRALFGGASALNFFSFFGFVGVAAIGVRLLRQRVWRSMGQLDILSRILMVLMPLTVIRYFLLPDEYEYVLLPIVMVFLALARQVSLRRWTLVACVGMFLPSLVHISMFDREIGSDVLRVAPKLNEGVVFVISRQLSYTLKSWRSETPGLPRRGGRMDRSQELSTAA